MQGSVRINAEPRGPVGDTLSETTMPSDLSMKTALIVRFSAELLEADLIVEEDREKIEVCFEEALKNAIVHGNGLQPERTLHARLFRTEHSWGLELTDQGAGFTSSDVPDPDDPDFPWREDGRGIQMMQHIAQDVRFFAGGRTVVISFRTPRQN